MLLLDVRYHSRTSCSFHFLCFLFLVFFFFLHGRDEGEEFNLVCVKEAFVCSCVNPPRVSAL